MNEFLIFPLRNEDGFRVTGLIEYQHMINTIVEAQLELAEDYPEDHIFVTYTVGEDGA